MINRSVFLNKIQEVLSDLKRKNLDPYNSINSKTANKIYQCVSTIDEVRSSQFGNHPILLFNPVVIHGNTFIMRLANIIVYSDAPGKYEVLIERKPIFDPRTKRITSPVKSEIGIAKGSFKVYKQGILKLFLNDPENNGHVQLTNFEELLGLSKGSPIHESLDFRQFTEDPGSPGSPGFAFSPPGSAFARMLTGKGFSPHQTGVVIKPKKSGDQLVHRLYTQHAGNPLLDPQMASTVDANDFHLIVDALHKVASINEPLFLPFDVKPEHIFLKISPQGKEFTVIDASTPTVTPLFLSEMASQYTGKDNTVASTVFDKAIENRNQLLETNYTAYQASCYIVAEAIVSTFIYIAATKYLVGMQNPVETLSRNPENITAIVQRALSDIQFIPLLFVSQWSPTFITMIQQALKNAQNLTSRNWYLILVQSFPLRPAFVMEDDDDDDPELW